MRLGVSLLPFPRPPLSLAHPAPPPASTPKLGRQHAPELASIPGPAPSRSLRGAQRAHALAAISLYLHGDSHGCQRVGQDLYQSVSEHERQTNPPRRAACFGSIYDMYLTLTDSCLVCSAHLVLPLSLSCSNPPYPLATKESMPSIPSGST